MSIRCALRLSVLPSSRREECSCSRLALRLEGTTPTTLRGAGTEFDSLRAYVVGDDPRDRLARLALSQADGASVAPQNATITL